MQPSAHTSRDGFWDQTHVRRTREFCARAKRSKMMMPPVPATRQGPKCVEHSDVEVDGFGATETTETNEMPDDLGMDLPSLHPVDMLSGSVSILNLQELSNVAVNHPDHWTNPSGIVSCSTWTDSSSTTDRSTAVTSGSHVSDCLYVLNPLTSNETPSHLGRAATASTKGSSAASIANLMNPLLDDEDDDDAEHNHQLQQQLFDAFGKYLPSKEPNATTATWSSSLESNTTASGNHLVDMIGLQRQVATSYHDTIQLAVFQNEEARRRCFTLGNATNDFNDPELVDDAVNLRHSLGQLAISAGIRGMNSDLVIHQDCHQSVLQGPDMPAMSEMVSLSENQVVPLPALVEDPTKRRLQHALQQLQHEEATLNHHLQGVLQFFEDTDDSIRNRFSLVAGRTTDVYRQRHLSRYIARKTLPPDMHMSSGGNQVEQNLAAIERKPETMDVTRVDVSMAEPPRRRGSLSVKARELLKQWFEIHKAHPYPNEDEKEALSRQCGISLEQVNNWFINTRGRKWKPVVYQLHDEQEAGHSERLNEIERVLQDPYRRRTGR